MFGLVLATIIGQALETMLFGMLGIFIVMGIIMLFVTLLNKVDESKKRKNKDKE